MSARILLIDDDRFLLQNLKLLLQAQGFSVVEACSGEEGFRAINEETPQLAIVDVNLPDIDGVSITRRIRANHQFPILMLTAKSGSLDKVVGLEVGADDYLTKPFDAMELVARVRALLRRSQEYAGLASSPKDEARIGDLVIDKASHKVRLGGREVSLTKKEFMLLEHLAANAGRLISRESLFEKNWDYDIEFGSNSLDVHIYRLRKKLEQDPEKPRYLHTVKGYGYMLEDRIERET